MKAMALLAEEKLLCPRAFKTKDTKGRQVYDEPCPVRTEFQRDRDRITHSKAFRRLMHKMQVFIDPRDDHYRTRLTHTLEVVQIARTMARALALNEDLTEAAALGHDLGHTPFGHSGERALDAIMDGGFRHYEQSIRVVDVLERNGNGLNLTYEVRDGILKHSGSNKAETLEGQLVKFADRIAYINHDIDDACRAGIMTVDDIPTHLSDILGTTHSNRITAMVSAVIAGGTDGDIQMAEPFGSAMLELRQFMFDKVYTSEKAKSEDGKVALLIEYLFEYYKKNPASLPAENRRMIDRDGEDRCICDHIAGMTDRYAISTFEEIYVPRVWSL
ncbi:MAG: deoxyguanosinetriphosphate triphosphohydrolase [Clostridia bacterium]|nr:deoxyguanosinetriphosphate triphosphohydrolase [Clostridia bacterium]